MLLVSTHYPVAVHQQHAITVALVTAAAVGGGIATACLCTGKSPRALLEKGRRWWARQKLAEFEADEGQPWQQNIPGPARCRPITTVRELLTWRPPQQTAVTTPSNNAHSTAQEQAVVVSDPCSCSTPLPPPAVQCSTTQQYILQDSKPQLLVCHDMMGGYLPEESILAGSANSGRYRIWHWDCIDIFVYFSHHLVTVPPTGWIHTAHKHGAKVLGTFITEFGQGRQRCNRLFSSNSSAEAVADQLVAIAGHYGFEGWLVNIENPLTKAQVAVMQHFVGYLRARMRAACSHGLVIWYDAVTVAGELRWQNKLSASNAPFFDLSDGLFLNYCWTPATLPESVLAAGRRRTDVFVGVDVFGRGCYGGGGHNTGLALACARAAGLSAALFAPGWVYENLDRSTFSELQERWWQQVQASWGVNHAVVHILPFSTNFNAGAGQAWFKAGALAATGHAAAAIVAHAAGAPDCNCYTEHNDGDQVNVVGPAADSYEGGGGWFNMLLTDTLPSCRDPIKQQVVAGPLVARLTSSTAFNGGSCLLVCKQHQSRQVPDPQQLQRSKQADAAVASNAAAATSAPYCSLRHASTAAIMSDTNTGKAGAEVTLLQLFKTDVPIVQDTVLQVQYVYASSDSKQGGSNNSSTADGTGTARIAPTVWIMTEPAAAAATTAVRQTPAQKAIHLPSTVDAQQAAFSTSQQLMSAEDQPSDVFVQLHAAEQVALTTVVVGDVHFLPVADSSRSSSAATSNASAVAVDDVSADAAWTADLSCRMAGWHWKKASWHLPVAAGHVITGIGVAVEISDISSHGGSDFIVCSLGHVQIGQLQASVQQRA